MQYHHCQHQAFSSMSYTSSAYVLLLSVFLAGLPGSGARGGKGAKGAGGGVSGYGHRGLHNAAAYEMTWEDIVLAMQLSGMCFGALLALCIVACCAYKICGPAEEEDYRRYRTSSFKPVTTRYTSELLREIYTVPTNTLSSANQTSTEKKDILPPTPPISSNPNIQRHILSEGSILGTAVSNDHTIQQQQQRPLPPPPPVNIPNGRAIMEEAVRGGSMMGGSGGGTGSTGGTGGCLSLGAVLDHRPRGVTISSLSTSRLLNEARRPGVAPRLAAHLNNSTLDLTHPHHQQQHIATFAPLHNSTRSLLEQPQTAIV